MRIEVGGERRHLGIPLPGCAGVAAQLMLVHRHVDCARATGHQFFDFGIFGGGLTGAKLRVEGIGAGIGRRKGRPSMERRAMGPTKLSVASFNTPPINTAEIPGNLAIAWKVSTLLVATDRPIFLAMESMS